MIDLTAAGLSDTEAKTYQALIEKPDWKPADLAQNVGETRTNCYKILDNLVAKGLAERFDKAKKLHYRATNPTRLLELAREQREARETSEKELELHAKELLHDYVKVNEQPGVRFYQGKEEILNIYDAYESQAEDIFYIHTTAGTDYHGSSAMDKIRAKALKNQIKRHGLTPDTPKIAKDFDDWDKRVQLNRTWLKASDYTSPVAWGAFGDKLYIISYGTEAIGMIIESPQIAEAFKQVFRLVERGQRNLPEYEKLPKLLDKTA
jgi:sugar-specific transcriptional regulator TrmB